MRIDDEPMLDEIQHFAFALTSKDVTLDGLWERTGDDFAGCLVRIETRGGELQGQITDIPRVMVARGWRVGDVKWRDIQPAGRQKYRLLDMFKHVDVMSLDVLNVRYKASTLRFLSDSAFFVETDRGSARKTSWRRVGVSRST